jgi:hypothetical protein
MSAYKNAQLRDFAVACVISARLNSRWNELLPPSRLSAERRVGSRLGRLDLMQLCLHTRVRMHMARGESSEVGLKGRSPSPPLHILPGRMETAVPCEMERYTVVVSTATCWLAFSFFLASFLFSLFLHLFFYRTRSCMSRKSNGEWFIFLMRQWRCQMKQWDPSMSESRLRADCNERQYPYVRDGWWKC